MRVAPGPNEAAVYLYRLRPGAGEEYDRRHVEVWQSLLADIDAAGIIDYTIWRRDELVVCFLRTTRGFDDATRVLAASEAQRRWSQELADLFDEVSDEHGQPLWLHKVFGFNE